MSQAAPPAGPPPPLPEQQLPLGNNGLNPPPGHGPAPTTPQPPQEAEDEFNEKATYPAPASDPPLAEQHASTTDSEKPTPSSSGSIIEDPADRMPHLAPSSTDTAATLTDEKSPAAPKTKRALFKRKPKVVDKDMGELVKPVSLRTMFRYAKPWEMTANFFGIFLACAAGATQPLMTLIFGRLTTSFTQFGMIVNEIAQEGATADNTARLEAAKVELKHDSGLNALYLMAIGIGMFVCTYVYMIIWNYTSEAQGRRIRERYLQAVLRQDIAYFDDLGAGEVATRIQSDCHLVQVGLGEKIPISCSYIATFITGFALAYARSPRLAGVLTVILPVIMAFGAFMGITVTKYTTQSLGFISKSGTLVEEVVSSIRTVQAFGTRMILANRFSTYIDKSRKAGLKSSLCEGIGLSFMFFTIYSAYALAFFYGAILMTQGLADAGLVINVFMAILIGSFSMAMLAPEMQAVSKGQAAAAKLFDTIERVPAIDSADPGGEQPSEVIGHITFDNVSFHYPSRANVPIFRDLSIDFAAGKTCALVGASGSGKSTVIQLIERFYDPIGGRVTLDGRDIRDLNLKWLRRQIGLVSQEPVLFATTVRGNVEHGLIGSKWEGASDAERFELVKKACIDANAHDFITKLPAGYDTMVGERGMLLSGGQKQRVAIARAIVSDPRILLLDEATSALDGHSERVVQDALDKAAIGRTTIVIAHRLATIKDADMILVVGGGEIVESGTHNQLLENEDGAYAKLVANQKLSQQAAKEASADVDDGYSDSEDSDDNPGSPLDSRGMPILERQITGRSVASQLLDQRRARHQADEAKYQKVKFSRLFVRLLKMNRDSWKLYTVGFIGAIASGMVYPALAILFGKAIADFQIDPIRNGDLLKSTINRKALWYFVTAILAAIAIFFQILGFSRSGWELVTKLRNKYFQAVLRHDIEWFDEDDNATGKVTSNLSDQPQKVQGLFGVTLGSIIQSIATLVGGCIIGLAYGPLLALIGIACIPLVVSAGYIRLRVVVLKDEKNKKWYAASANMASEAAGAVRTVAALTREDDVSRLYSQELETPFRTSNKVAIYSQALYAASQGMAFLVIALVFYIGALWIADGKYDTATFFTTLTATVFAAIQAGNVFMFVPDASSANASARSIFRVLDDEPEIDADATDGLILDPSKVEGTLRLEKIHFRYPSRPGVRVLRNLTIDVPAGKYVALVGPSGCGKSTTIQMIERFYDPLAGMVTLDSVDIREININSYRSHIALVSQEPTLYAGTIKFNILLGAAKPMEEVTQEEIEQACRDANIYDFIMSLPDGFDTEVGGKGSQLSGGQKQRVAIARALVRNPKILLLDEATAALDSTSERVVQQALDNAAKGRAVVAIAHRLSTIQNADMIYFVSDGGVLEKGTHAELIARKGAYYELVQMQNLSKV